MKFIDNLSFFEHLNFGDSERIHSEFLCWLISEKSDVLSTKEREEFVNNLFDISDTNEIIKIGTEIDSIDILIETNNTVIVIENKLKSSQHSNQLYRYEQFINNKYPDKEKVFVFLTLIKEQVTNTSNWKHISYFKIYNLISELNIDDKKNKVYVNDYLLFLNNLLSLLNEVSDTPNKFPYVFENGIMKKSEKLNRTYDNSKEEFISKNQFETIFQKAYLTQFLEETKKIKGYLGETRGTALIDYVIKNNIEYKNKKYHTMVQIQGKTIKFAFQIQRDYDNSKSKWINDILPVFKQIKTENTKGFKRYNPPTSKAYVSMSKTMETPYWLMTKENFIKIILEEIKNARELTEILINKI